MASAAGKKRLQKEYAFLQKSSPPFVFAKPLETNVLEWHYIIRGPKDTPYHGGEYHGQLIFPPTYPFAPPSIKMTTPSGRFSTNTRICMSMSDFHPGSWCPSWSVSTILTGMLSFMCSNEFTTGSITTTDAEKKRYAAQSHAWNISGQNKKFVEVFKAEGYAESAIKDPPNMGEGDIGGV